MLQLILSSHVIFEILDLNLISECNVKIVLDGGQFLYHPSIQLVLKRREVLKITECQLQTDDLAIPKVIYLYLPPEERSSQHWTKADIVNNHLSMFYRGAAGEEGVELSNLLSQSSPPDDPIYIS